MSKRLTVIERNVTLGRYVSGRAHPVSAPASSHRDVREEVIDVIDLQAHQAVTDARMVEDQQRAQRARQRPRAARSNGAHTYWPELLLRLTRPRSQRRDARLDKAA